MKKKFLDPLISGQSFFLFCFKSLETSFFWQESGHGLRQRTVAIAGLRREEKQIYFGYDRGSVITEVSYLCSYSPLNTMAVGLSRRMIWYLH